MSQTEQDHGEIINVNAEAEKPESPAGETAVETAGETSEIRASEKEASEKEVSEKEISEKKAPKKKASAEKTSEEEVSEKKAPEKKAPQKKTSRKAASEKMTSNSARSKSQQVPAAGKVSAGKSPAKSTAASNKSAGSRTKAAAAPASRVRRSKKRRVQSISASFEHAFEGIEVGIGERNMKIHCIMAVLVVFFGFILHISVTEWCICLVLFGLIMGLELVNTAIESVVDLATQEYHPLAKRAKDTAAGAVLIASIMAAIAGLIIFIPRLLYLFRIF